MRFQLETTRLSISTLELSDLDAFVRYRQDSEIARFQSWDIDFSREQGLELIHSQIGVAFPAPGDWLQLGIREISTGKLLGDLALHALESENRFEIGFTLDPAHQGKGFAKEAAAKLVEFLFKEKHALSVEASTDRRNVASIKLLKSLGFTQLPGRSWDEEFKGETVTVDVFEINRNFEVSET
jgi:aminoglycoside 6'-N-acetyltransferase